MNKKRYHPISDTQIEDEERFRLIYRMLKKLKELEDERNSLKTQTSTNFFGPEGAQGRPTSSAVSDYMNFKPIREN